MAIDLRSLLSGLQTAGAGAMPERITPDDFLRFWNASATQNGGRPDIGAMSQEAPPGVAPEAPAQAPTLADIISPTAQPEQATPDLNAPPAELFVERPEPRTGMFGIRGTFRDILGTIGDALLAQGGRNPTYRPRRDEERIADAMGPNFAENPMEAIERLQQAGYATRAAEMYNELTEQELNRQRVQSAAAAQAALTQERNHEMFSRFAGTLTNETWSQQLPRVVQMAERLGIEIPNPPANYDPAWVETIQRVGIDPYRVGRLDQLERNVESQIADRDRRFGETTRRNRVLESQGQARVNQGGARLAEQGRRNRTQEELARERIEIARERNANRGRPSRQRTGSSQQQQRGSGGPPPMAGREGQVMRNRADNTTWTYRNGRWNRSGPWN